MCLDLASGVRGLRILFFFSDMVFYTSIIEEVLSTRKCKEESESIPFLSTEIAILFFFTLLFCILSLPLRFPLMLQIHS